MAQWSTTYSGLVSLIETYCVDDTTELDSVVNGCINRAEERVLRDLDLNVWNDVVSASTAEAQNYTKTVTAAPVLGVYFTAAGVHAERRSREYVQSYGGQGRPLYYADDDDTIYWAPAPDGIYAIRVMYLTRPTPLSISTTTNWLSTHAADALLWASLIEAEHFLVAPERIAEFEKSYASTIGPLRAFWRPNAQNWYEPIGPTPQPVQTR